MPKKMYKAKHYLRPSIEVVEANKLTEKSIYFGKCNKTERLEGVNFKYFETFAAAKWYLLGVLRSKIEDQERLAARMRLDYDTISIMTEDERTAYYADAK